MPRPNQKSERRGQILDAYEACIIKYGVEGATLEKVAREAGLARALLRHNVGNREALLNDLIERFLDRTKKESEELMAALPDKGKTLRLLDWRFDTEYVGPNSIQVAAALIAASTHIDGLDEKMSDWTRDFMNCFLRTLSHDFPRSDPEDIRAIAVGITGIYFNMENLEALALGGGFNRASKRAARLLVNAQF